MEILETTYKDVEDFYCRASDLALPLHNYLWGLLW